jgi:hypothetical protein
MLDFRTGQILGLLLRTLPFVLLRLVVYIGITLAYVIAVGVGGGIGLLFGKIGGSGGGGSALGGLIGFGIVSGLLYWAREYLLYLVKAGHVAVLVELLDGKQIPGGKGQIDYATSMVKEHFATSSMLFGLNQLIRGILRAFNNLTLSIASWLPIPGLDTLVKLVDKIINTGLSHLDQVILAQILRRHTDNPWAVARDSIVLYAQNYKGVLENAAFLTFIIWGLTLVILLLVAAPIAALIGLFHVHAGIWTFALAVIAALSLKAALIDPFATTALIQMYDKLTAGQTPNPEWSAKLESMSDKFRELTQKAREAMTPPPAAPTTTSAALS